MRPLRVAVLASGRGSNFEAIAKANLPIELVGVFSDKPAARALELARARGVPAVALDAKKYTDRKTFDREFFARVAEAKPDLLVLAGFMRVIDDAVIAAWHGRAINIHPSLLPKYAGLRTHQRALDAGDRVHGASVHFVTAELDGGPVIAQVELDIRDGDDRRIARRAIAAAGTSLARRDARCDRARTHRARRRRCSASTARRSNRPLRLECRRCARTSKRCIQLARASLRAIVSLEFSP